MQNEDSFSLLQPFFSNIIMQLSPLPICFPAASHSETHPSPHFPFPPAVAVPSYDCHEMPASGFAVSLVLPIDRKMMLAHVTAILEVRVFSASQWIWETGAISCHGNMTWVLNEWVASFVCLSILLKHTTRTTERGVTLILRQSICICMDYISVIPSSHTSVSVGEN